MLKNQTIIRTGIRESVYLHQGPTVPLNWNVLKPQLQVSSPIYFHTAAEKAPNETSL